MRMLNEAMLRVLSGWYSLKARASKEDGQTLAEYALILAVIALVGVAAAVLFFQNTISGAFTAIAGCISAPATGCGAGS